MIYWLNGILENILFDGFVFEDDEDSEISDLFYPKNTRTVGRNWTIRSLASQWITPSVFGNVHKWNDYPCFDQNIPVFSNRAIKVLAPFLDGQGEFLSLPEDAGEFQIFHVTRLADVLDVNNSELEWIKGAETEIDRGRPFGIERYEFHADRLGDLTIFQIPELTTHIFVTQPFVNAVSEYNLQGFHLVKVWPNDDGKTWREREDELCDKEVKIKSLKKPIV